MSLYFSWKQKLYDFLIFPGGIERDQRHEMGEGTIFIEWFGDH